MRIPKPSTDYALVHKIEEYLDMDFLTEIDTEMQLGAASEGLVRQYANGHSVRPNLRSNYVRPMFEILPPGYSGSGRVHANPCPACDDWSRTPRCADHPEVGVERSKLGGYTPATHRTFDATLTLHVEATISGFWIEAADD